MHAGLPWLYSNYKGRESVCVSACACACVCVCVCVRVFYNSCHTAPTGSAHASRLPYSSTPALPAARTRSQSRPMSAPAERACGGEPCHARPPVPPCHPRSSRRLSRSQVTPPGTTADHDLESLCVHARRSGGSRRRMRCQARWAWRRRSSFRSTTEGSGKEWTGKERGHDIEQGEGRRAKLEAKQQPKSRQSAAALSRCPAPDP